MNIEKSTIIKVLKQCFDPEIPIDLWSLGLIYDIKIKEKMVCITMSLTTPGCTMGEHMAEDIKSKLKTKGITDVKVNVVFDPPWQPQMMTEEAREKLGFPKTNKKIKANDESWE
tara:strand:+ start:184 stop:525 length:342 start_codon:yes stop_codon:yes gene_type:complete